MKQQQGPFVDSAVATFLVNVENACCSGVLPALNCSNERALTYAMHAAETGNSTSPSVTQS